MTRDRLAQILLNIGGVLMVIGAIFDLSISAPPAMWEPLLGQAPASLHPAVQQLLLALIHALGSVLLAAGIAVLLLVNGPVRRSDRAAGLAVLVLVVVGEGGNGFQMVLLGGTYGWVVLLYILPVVAGLALRYLAPVTLRRGTD